MESSYFIDGVGDEVVLLVTFLCILILLTIFVLCRQRTAVERNQQDVVVENTEIETDASEVSINSSLHQRVPSPMISLNLVMQQERRSVSVSQDMNLTYLQRQYFSDEMSSGQVIRFIYHGRILHDTQSTLAALGIQDQTSLHVHLTRRNEERPMEYTPIDISSLFVPLISLILSLCWISLVMWPFAFTFSTKLMMFVFSVAFVYLVYRSRLN